MFTIIDCDNDMICKKTTNKIFATNEDTKIPIAYSRVLFIVERDGGFYLETYDINFEYISDTWYNSYDEAIKQATFEYGEIKYKWCEIQSCFGGEVDYLDYVKSVLTFQI